MSNNIRWGRVTVLVALAVVAVAAVGLIGVSLHSIPSAHFTPEIALTVLLVASIVAFLAILIIAVAIFAALGLSDHAQAFGLPEGSVRAVIALSLLIIFSIVAIYLYGRLRDRPTFAINSITQEQVNALPSDRIVAKVPDSVDAKLYNVTLMTNSGVSDDFAKQMLATISTLVVAVAGFYFGARTSSASKRDTTKATLSILSPTSPAKLQTDSATGKPLPMSIIVETKPLGLAVEARLDGRVDSSISQTAYNEFKYEPQNLLKNDIAISIALAAQSDVRQVLTVKGS
jgi:hypothetical protein